MTSDLPSSSNEHYDLWPLSQWAAWHCTSVASVGAVQGTVSLRQYSWRCERMYTPGKEALCVRACVHTCAYIYQLTGLRCTCTVHLGLSPGCRWGCTRSWYQQGQKTAASHELNTAVCWPACRKQAITIVSRCGVAFSLTTNNKVTYQQQLTTTTNNSMFGQHQHKIYTVQ